MYAGFTPLAKAEVVKPVAAYEREEIYSTRVYIYVCLVANVCMLENVLKDHT